MDVARDPTLASPGRPAFGSYSWHGLGVPFSQVGILVSGSPSNPAWLTFVSDGNSGGGFDLIMLQHLRRKSHARSSRRITSLGFSFLSLTSSGLKLIGAKT